MENQNFFYETRNQPITNYYGKSIGAFPLHFHREVELLFSFGETIEIEISQQRFTLSEGDCAIVFPNELHAYLSSNDSPHITLIFQPDWIPDFSAVFENYRTELPIVTTAQLKSNSSDAVNSLNALQKMSQAGREIDPKLLKGYLTILLYRILEQLPLFAEPATQNSNMLYSIINYLNTHVTEPLSLADLSGALGYSRYEISRIFSQKLHTSFTQYRNMLRLQMAAPLLTETSRPIIDIAFSCGFESLRTFYRAFEQQYRMSPKEFRSARSIPPRNS